MGLDISFQADHPAAAELDGQRLTNIPGFLNFVRALGRVLQFLHDSGSTERAAFQCYRDCVALVERQAAPEIPFEAYLAFLKETGEMAAAIPFSLDAGDYDPVAGRLAAVWMLGGEPISGSVARTFLGVVSELLVQSRALIRIVPLFDTTTNVLSGEWMVEVLEKYKRCLEVAAENDLSFRIEC